MMARGVTKAYQRMDEQGDEGDDINSPRSTGRLTRRLKWRAGGAARDSPSSRGDLDPPDTVVDELNKPSSPRQIRGGRSLGLAKSKNIRQPGSLAEDNAPAKQVAKRSQTAPGGLEFESQSSGYDEQQTSLGMSWTGEFPSEFNSNRGATRSSIREDMEDEPPEAPQPMERSSPQSKRPAHRQSGKRHTAAAAAAASLDDHASTNSANRRSRSSPSPSMRQPGSSVENPQRVRRRDEQPDDELNLADLEQFQREQRIQQFEAARDGLKPKKPSPILPASMPRRLLTQQNELAFAGTERNRPNPIRRSGSYGHEPVVPVEQFHHSGPITSTAHLYAQRSSESRGRRHSGPPAVLKTEMPKDSTSTKMTEEEEALRLAMQMSLRSFEDHEQVRRSHEKLMPDTTLPSGDGSESQLIAEMNVSGSSGMDQKAADLGTPNVAAEASIAQQLAFARQTMSRAEADAIEAALRATGELGRRNELGEASTTDDCSPIKHLTVPQQSVSTDPAAYEHQEDLVAGATHLSEQDRRAIAAALHGDQPSPSQIDNDLTVALELQQQEALEAQRERERTNWNQAARPVVPHVGALAGAGAYHSSDPVPRHPLELEEEERRRALAAVAATTRTVDRTTAATVAMTKSLTTPRPGDQSLLSALPRTIDPNIPSRPTTLLDLITPQNDQNNDSLTDVDTDGEHSARSRKSMESDAEDDLSFVSGKAFGVLQRTVNRRGPGSIASSRSHSTRGSVDSVRSSLSRTDALEPRERMHINKAITAGLMSKCNGAVKEGKEADIFHAKSANKNDHDVAIKVIKRIEEMRRQSGTGPALLEELEHWAEKEYHHLEKASAARVPVPSPLLQKENLIFMRFMGEDGWPAPQLKDVEISRGSPKWGLLYSQIMVAIRRLYVNARLVHGDLSEYNVLVAPSYLVENRDEGTGGVDPRKSVQSCLIDFSRAVSVDHPDATKLLERDLTRIREFFLSKGTKTLGTQMAMEFVVAPDPDDDEDEEDEEQEQRHQQQKVVPKKKKKKDTRYPDDPDKGSDGDDESGDSDEEDAFEQGYYTKYQTQGGSRHSAKAPASASLSSGNSRKSETRKSEGSGQASRNKGQKRGSSGRKSREGGLDDEMGNFPPVFGAFPETFTFQRTESDFWQPEWEEAQWHSGPDDEKR